jgi:hypothetical protein
MREHSPSPKPWMSQAAESAGIPFDGREFRPHPFDGDDGSCPETLAAALELWATEASGEAMRAVVDSLRSDRVLVPLLAEAGDFGYTEDGKVVEKTQELSIVSVEGPDGKPVAVAFSDVESMAAWNSDARPIPVEAQKVAAWVLDDQMARIVLNPGSDTQCVVRRGGVIALLTGDPYTPPWLDHAVADGISEAFDSGESVTVSPGWHLQGGNGPDLSVEVTLPAGLTKEQLAQRQAQWASVWGSNELVNQRVDGIHLKLVATPPSQ